MDRLCQAIDCNILTIEILTNSEAKLLVNASKNFCNISKLEEEYEETALILNNLKRILNCIEC